MNPVTIIGGGLAGCEAAWQLVRRDIPVSLIDMKPGQMTPAHHLPLLGELVCSNSLRAVRLENAVGLLKEEMRRLDSLIIQCADATALPAGGALAVDRDSFARMVTERLRNHPLVTLVEKQVDRLPAPAAGIVITATGPLTEGHLFDDIRLTLGQDTLHFFDAAAPIVTAESINTDIAFRQSRYDRGGADYLNCPMDEAAYQLFWEALVSAELADVHAFDREIVFEGCMPVESMARRGRDTIRFGPLKPVGLKDPRTGREPYACVQLRQDNQAATLYNLVGFQTRLKYGEQIRVFRLIPGLEQAEFVRFGVMHRNTYLDSPRLLAPDYSCRQRPSLYFAGQMTGVEGYVESASSGLIAGRQAAMQAAGFDEKARQDALPSAHTVIGALAHYVARAESRHFQPMNANFGLVAAPDLPFKGKSARQQAIIAQALTEIDRLGSIGYNK